MIEFKRGLKLFGFMLEKKKNRIRHPVQYVLKNGLVYYTKADCLFLRYYKFTVYQRTPDIAISEVKEYLQ